MSRFYEADELYKRSSKLDSACTVLFWVNCVFTIIALCPSSFQTLIIAIQVLSAIIHVVLGLVNDCTLWFDAVSTNRKHL